MFRQGGFRNGLLDFHADDESADTALYDRLRLDVSQIPSERDQRRVRIPHQKVDAESGHLGVRTSLFREALAVPWLDPAAGLGAAHAPAAGERHRNRRHLRRCVGDAAMCRADRPHFSDRAGAQANL